MRTIGVEEELLIVSAGSGLPLPLAGSILATVGTMGSGPVLKSEFKQEQIEVNTRPCGTVDELLTEILAGRALADAAARVAGSQNRRDRNPAAVLRDSDPGEQTVFAYGGAVRRGCPGADHVRVPRPRLH